MAGINEKSAILSALENRYNGLKSNQNLSSRHGGAGGGGGSATLSSNKTSASRSDNKMAFGGIGQAPTSKPSISFNADGGTTIKGGHSVSHGSGLNSSYVVEAKGQKNGTMDSVNNGMRIQRPEGNLTIEDDSKGFNGVQHPNQHNASSTKESPLTIKPGLADGDKYIANLKAGSTTTIQGEGKTDKGSGERDTINLGPHLHSPSSTAEVKLENFNPSKTDLQLNGKSLFGEADQSLSGTINLSRENNDSSPKVNMNLKED